MREQRRPELGSEATYDEADLYGHAGDLEENATKRRRRRLSLWSVGLFFSFFSQGE